MIIARFFFFYFPALPDTPVITLNVSDDMQLTLPVRFNDNMKNTRVYENLMKTNKGKRCGYFFSAIIPSSADREKRNRGIGKAGLVHTSTTEYTGDKDEYLCVYTPPEKKKKVKL